VTENKEVFSVGGKGYTSVPATAMRFLAILLDFSLL
jgi:hypothetical protein